MEHDMEHGWLLHGTLARAKTPTASTPVSALQKEKRKTSTPDPSSAVARTVAHGQRRAPRVPRRATVLANFWRK